MINKQKQACMNGREALSVVWAGIPNPNAAKCCQYVHLLHGECGPRHGLPFRSPHALLQLQKKSPEHRCSSLMRTAKVFMQTGTHAVHICMHDYI